MWKCENAIYISVRVSLLALRVIHLLWQNTLLLLDHSKFIILFAMLKTPIKWYLVRHVLNWIIICSLFVAILNCFIAN